MPRDPAKAREWKRRYLRRKKIEKYGPEFADVNMTGRHGNHARGIRSGKWNAGKLMTSQGYVAVRVPINHPHAWGAPGPSHRYAYEHIVVAMEHLGRSLRDDEIVHHKNGKRADNRWENLEVLTRSQHARHHSDTRERDELGRFPPEDLRVQELPEAQP